MLQEITVIFSLFFLSFSCLFASCATVYAAPVTVEAALKAVKKRIATDEVFRRAARQSGVRFRIGEVRKIDFGRDSAPAYAVTLLPQGYMVVSADDRMRPIIAYSADSDLDLTDTEANALRAMLKADLVNTGRLLRGLEAKGMGKSPSPISRKMEEHRRSWNILIGNSLISKGSLSDSSLQYTDSVSEDSVTSVEFDPTDPVIGPLLGALKWNQNNHYNELCPVDPDASDYYDGHMPTGCVATATGQIMKYYSWPPYGRGSHAYTWNSQVLSAFFDDPFQWNLMKDSYDPWSPEPLDAEMAVSELLYEIGVAVEMDYDTDGSSASTGAANRALATYFYYSSGLSNKDQDEFQAILQQEIEEGHPVMAGLTGHAVVIDGRNSSVSPATFHVNYGWGGINNGWYDLDSFPSNDVVREIITGIVPLQMALMDKPSAEPDSDGSYDLSWHYPWYWNGKVTGFKLLEAVYSPSDFTDSADTFDSWMAVTGWEVSDSGYSGLSFYFPPDRKGDAPLEFIDPLVPEEGSQVAFYAKAVVLDARLLLEVSTDNGRSWQTLLVMDNNNSTRDWEHKNISLEEFSGRPILLRFRVDATSNPFNYYKPPYGGIWVDEIDITSCELPDWQVLRQDIPASVFSAAVTSRENGSYLYRILSCNAQGCGSPSPAITVNVEIPHLAGDFDMDGDVDGRDAAVMAAGGQDISVEEFASLFGTVQ